MRHPPLACVLFSALVVFPACGGDDDGDGPPIDAGTEPLDLPEGCQPLLGGEHCGLPYPSDYFLVDDATTPTGKRVQPSGAASLVTTIDRNADVHSVDVHDGASAIPTIVAMLPDEVADVGLVHLAGPAEDSVADDARTIILAPDGTQVPHYVDLDPRATDPTRRAIVIHPLVGLEHRTRYIVALRGIETEAGELAAPAEGFRRLRDGETEGEDALEPLVDRYESDVFAPLAEAGWQREEVQLAWDFTVGSSEGDVSDMLRVRELTLDWLAKNEPVVSEVTLVDDPKTGRVVKGKITGPLFLVENAPGAALARDDDGLVVQNGTAAFDFVAVVPPSVRDQKGPGLALAYGHGFFGGIAEVEGGSARTIANTVGAVLFGVTWLGMSNGDLPVLIGNLTGAPASTVSFADRVHQAVANWIVMGAAIEGPLLTLDELRREPGGASFYSAEILGFIGISQGSILGGVMSGLNPFLDRICLQVGGAGFTHMMFRARPFTAFLEVIDQILPDPVDQQLFAATLQRSFDRFDSGSYADYLLTAPIDPKNLRPLLLQIGLGDVSVPNLGSFLHARLVGVSLIEPSPVAVYGLATTEGPIGAGLSLYDFGIDLSVYDQFQPSPENNEVHESVRLEPAALEQLGVFLREGTVTHTCEGPCDPG
jgi:hypothetical protein